MPIVERDLTSFTLPPNLFPPKFNSSITHFTLISSPNSTYKDFTWTLTFPLPNTYRILLTAPNRPQSPQDNVILQYQPLPFKLVSLDLKRSNAVFSFPRPTQGELDGGGRTRELHLDWSDQLVLSTWEISPGQTAKTQTPTQLLCDVPVRSYALTEHGIMRHYSIDRNRLHLGLGERAAPLNLTGRSFQMHGTDAALYDAWESDPLYKHTPFLISTPRGGGTTYAIYHPTNSNAQWDVNRLGDVPSTNFMTFTQDYGGLEEWVMVGKGVREVVRTFAEIVGRPRLVGRDWLGYLGSTMSLAESASPSPSLGVHQLKIPLQDDPPAQNLLSEWPALCKKYDIPCSAMFLSSGFTVDEKTGNRYVFHMNKKRFPDFKGMIAVYHRAGMKIATNIKPYALETHPAYKRLHSADALFHDPATGGAALQNIWSSANGTSAKGSWVDMTANEGRDWWSEGVKGLVELGVDGLWDDNNEFSLRDDAILFKNDFDNDRTVPMKGPQTVGLMGRQTGTEMMNKVSQNTLEASNPERRTYVLTRSGNVGTFKYATGTWSGDNATSWKNLRGSQPVQLNAGLSLMQSYGSDVGGFAGDFPTPELFVRWVQLGVTHSRFCIHSNDKTPSGDKKLNNPWMVGYLLPLVDLVDGLAVPRGLACCQEGDQVAIRASPLLASVFCLFGFFPDADVNLRSRSNSLMWNSHLHAIPTTLPLFFGEFASDPTLYTPKLLEGFDAWIGPGQLLSAPALYEGMFSREVYFPKSSPNDGSLYFDLHEPYGRHQAGTWTTIATPWEHAGLFAREGAVIPIGKDCATVTQTSGPARTNIDGVDTVLESDGGVVGLDDWRGVRIFPGTDGRKHKSTWIEDDGVLAEPERTMIEVTYSSKSEEVVVSCMFVESGYVPLWGRELHVVLPVGDGRVVKGVKEGTVWGVKEVEVERREWRGREVWVVQVGG